MDNLVAWPALGICRARPDHRRGDRHQEPCGRKMTTHVKRLQKRMNRATGNSSLWPGA
jgi:hypothetical protein